MDTPDLQPEHFARDAAVDLAMEELRQMFAAEPRRLFYSTQIETRFERRYFHWVTGRALLELATSKRIHRNAAPVQEKLVNFYANSGHRYWRREQAQIIELLHQIFDPQFARALGHHGELMVDAALGRRGFRTEAQNTNTWAGRTWTQTNHNLDRIISRDGITYGVEIKNTQNYIPRNELQTKLAMCSLLGIKPLFVMRFAPKTYNYQVISAHGFSLLYEHQLYPFGYDRLVQQVSAILDLKVHSPRVIPEGHIQRFIHWHNRQIAP